MLCLRLGSRGLRGLIGDEFVKFQSNAPANLAERGSEKNESRDVKLTTETD